MTRVETAPYLRIDPARVEAGPWLDSATALPIPAFGIEGWDPTVDLEVERLISIDLEGARNDAGLDARDELVVAATWHCPATTMRGAGSRLRLAGREMEDRVRLYIPGRELAGRVVLRTVVTLAAKVQDNQPLAAMIPGSVLWVDSTMIALEGRGSRFPMEWLDFGAAGWLPDGAGWYLEWSPEHPEAPALGAVRLYLNEDHPAVRAAVVASPPEVHHRAIRDAIEFDVARSLIVGALRADAASWDEAAGDPGSIAAVVNRLLSVVFPTESLEGLRTRYKATPQRLETRIQDGLRLFRELPLP
ncbi:MAG: hypothetical protein FIA92_11505 [Chloroflexi bacterium]|nr:hypothetical protein [Chloroflexota bacterium]